MSYFEEITFSNSQFPVNIGSTLRISSKHNLGYGKKINYDNSELVESIGTGTDLFSNNINTMSVTSGQYRIRQSKIFYPYYPGNPQLTEFTCINFQSETGIIKRLGYFSSSTISPYDTGFDGYFLESSNGSYFLKIYNNGSLITNPIEWTSFDNYNLISNYDFANFTVFALDFLWLGGVGLRLFMVVNGKLELIHTYAHAGNSNQLIFKSPQQPVRYEIRSTTGSGSFVDVCHSVDSEGIENSDDGYGYSISTGIAGISMQSLSNTYLIMALRKKDNFRENYVQLVKAYLYTKSNTNVSFLLLKNPNIAGALSYTPKNNSCIEYAFGNGTTNTITGGFELEDGTFYQRNEVSKTFRDYMSILGQSINGTKDIIALCAKADSNNTVITGSMKVIEI